MTDRLTFAEKVSDALQDLARDAGVSDPDALDQITDDLVPAITATIDAALTAHYTERK